MFKNLFKPKLWKPFVFENSKIPVWLSKIAPIDIWAVSFFVFVFCRGEMTEETRRHETIHFQQQLELLFVGQWILYGIFYCHNYLKYRNGATAYMQNKFELEAYAMQGTEGYLKNRPRFAWTRM